MILNAGLPGHAPREVTLIAQIVRHQRKGAPDSEDLGALTHPGDGDAVRRCALLLRLADELDSAGDRAVRSARVVADRRRLHLELTGDAALASWRVRRQLADGELRRAFGRPLVLAA